jgi:serine/threonine-protein kinase
MDFGIARASAVPSITQTSAVVGTAQYIAPEQAQGLEVDPRTDVYALGCCLYEMLTGQVPFTGPTPVAIAYRHVREDPTPPRALNPDVPVSLERVCLKAMAKSPEDRYQTAVDFQQDLERVRVGDPVRVAGPLPSQQTTQAIGAVGYGQSPTTVLGGGSTVSGDRAVRYAQDVPDQRRGSSVGWVIAAILALLVVGFAAFLITRAVTSPDAATSTTTPPTTSLAPSTSAPTTTAATTTTAPTTTKPPPTTKPPTTTVGPTSTTEPPTTTAGTTTEPPTST